MAFARSHVLTENEWASPIADPLSQPSTAGNMVKIVLFLALSVLISTLATVPEGGGYSNGGGNNVLLRPDGFVFSVRIDLILSLFLFSVAAVVFASKEASVVPGNQVLAAASADGAPR